MNRNIRNIIREKIIRINILREEVTKNVIKSINQNNNINNSIKIYTNFKVNKNLKKNHTNTRKNKICIMTGKRSCVLKGFSFSRYTIKNLILKNRLTNIKKHNW